jgi:formyl-CoA transferase
VNDPPTRAFFPGTLHRRAPEAASALVALHARGASGRGQVVDSAIYEAVLAMMESLIPEYALAGYLRERSGPILPNIVPSNVYPCLGTDSILVAANQDTVFRRLAAAMSMPELADDERYATHSARGRSQEELDTIFSGWTAGYAADDILDLLEEAGVPAGRIYRAPDMLRDEHFAARESIVTVEHDEFGPFPMQNVAPRLSATPGSVREAGPQLGEHTDLILRELLGLTEAEIAGHRAEGTI